MENIKNEHGFWFPGIEGFVPLSADGAQRMLGRLGARERSTLADQSNKK
jgi:hypothetical protein